MPGWHDATRELQQAGRLRMAGIIQEQHPDRARLFMQWKRMDWPILVDPLNLLEVPVVPLTLAIDEHGIIRAVNPPKETIEADFVSKRFAAPVAAAAARVTPASADVSRPADEAPLEAWKEYGRQLFLWRPESAMDDAIRAFERVLARTPQDGPAHFRLGVAYRARYDSAGRQAADFQNAVGHWERALAIDPNQYIWRRRIQQYGPRLDKPYPFYDWVPQARREIAARGEEPVPLAVEPGGAEFARPVKKFEEAADDGPEPDPQGRIFRDHGELILAETVAVPFRIAPGSATRIHVIFRPNLDRKAHWNNEVDDLVLWVNPPVGWAVDARHHTAARPKQVVSQETRRVELELRCPDGASPGLVTVPAYALYYVCEDVDGMCLYRRQDVAVQVHVRR